MLYITSDDSKVSYIDNDYNGDLDERKSTSGYIITVGSVAFSWPSKKLLVVSLLSCEAEYIALTPCAYKQYDSEI